MGVIKKIFGNLNGENIYEYVLDNNNGISVHILNYGGIIKNLYVTDKDGQKRDVVLGRETLDEYLDNKGRYGAAIGRNSNRIQNAEFIINGEKYLLAKNDGNNNLHGGIKGFDKKVWNTSILEDTEEPEIAMVIVSPDGEEGFPGKVTVIMTYTLTKENSLKINYKAISDKDTIVNLTNHSYFNLSGHDSGNIYNQILQLNSSFYTPNTYEGMPMGEILSVNATPMDFRVPKPVGQDIDADFDQIQMFGGYDHNFIIDGSGYRIGAVMKSLESGIVMEMKTDLPGVQLYTGNGIDDKRICKNGVKYPVHGGLCLETQVYPNSAKYAHYPDTVLKAGDIYNTTTEYVFKIEK